VRLRYLAFAWIAIAIPTACSLTSLDGFSGGAPDAALDTTTTDGGPGADAVFVPPSDARSDARSDGAGPGVVCPQKPVALCEPFATDEKTNGWEISQGGGATVGI